MGEDRTDGAGRRETAPEVVPLRTLLAYVRPHAPGLVTATLLSGLAAVLALAQPLVVKRVFSDLSASRPVTTVVLVIVALFLAEAVLGALQGYLLGRIGEGIVLNLRTTLVGRLLRWPLATHERHRSGDLISRVSTDSTAVRSALASSLTEILAGVLTFVGSLALMLFLDPLMLGLTLGCLVVAVLAVFAVSVRIMGATVQAQRSVGRLSAGLERALRAIRTVKLSTAEEREQEQLVGEVRDAYRAGVRQAKLEALVHPVTSVAVQGALVLVLGIGGARVAHGSMELGELIAFLLYLLYLAVPMGTLFASVTDLQAGRAALARVEELVREPLETGPPDVPDPADGTGPQGPAGARGAEDPPDAPAVVVRAVGFAYPSRPGVPALEHMEFEVPRLSRTALVGPSGAGKSSVLALIGRLYDPDSGAIELFGRDVRDLPINELRGMIGHVEQDAPVLAGTLRSNLTYACPDASAEQLADVLRKTNLADFVDALPDGLETDVGDGGVLLSGGQRQRVAIARMLLKRPEVLLLDEVTSQMDAENEHLLQETLREAARTCTVLVVAHRLSTVRDADQILVVDEGRVRARGTHASLLREDALYAHLASTQFLPSGMCENSEGNFPEGFELTSG
ncbi:ABC transporter ATP-binding protein [Streptomyces sp. NPDC090445]|uniref:ABC transporter ATP-binding protein n=1 Tax=Streptomyces sp. NPDC090445 TaxID=3365963 RepID=UPI00381843C6